MSTQTAQNKPRGYVSQIIISPKSGKVADIFLDILHGQFIYFIISHYHHHFTKSLMDKLNYDVQYVKFQKSFKVPKFIMLYIYSKSPVPKYV